ncbi:hypothetical protein [Pseudomonas segetis]|uniref:Uncharacterized protein n=1 Tax=Pseudomonas segetis TaxID=298908 RepID=A0A239IH99_9PSED|nr:hypothetical protein [Pseudomonas segetis]SNS91794.1 hypothetical protein SAMN05216255_3844 [Pseudomonas segetis]
MTYAGFKCDLKEEPLSGRLIYRESEYSIDFVDCSREEIALRTGGQGCCSLVIGTLQIEVGVETGRLLYPWGLCPLINCEPKHMPMNHIDCGSIYIESAGFELVAGVAIEIPGSNLWQMFKDMATGWICIGDYDMGDKIRLVQFSKSAMISLSDEVAIAVWIRPEVEL